MCKPRSIKAVCTRILAVLAVLGAVSCGGGGADSSGVGSGGTGITASDNLTVGSITGFGSVIVNDVRYSIDSITPQIQDTNALALGMTVQIRGQVDATGLEGTASSLISAAEVRGKITSLDKVALTLRVYDFPVDVDLGTIIAGADHFAQLAVGDEVQIHGLPSSGMLLATRIEKIAAPSAPILTGAVSGLDTGKTSFKLGGISVSYGKASLKGFGSLPLVNDTVVRVRASAAPVNNVLQASVVERWISVPETGTSGLAVTGPIENFTSVSQTFTVAGITIDASTAPLKADMVKKLANGSYVTIKGVYSAGVLTATEVKFLKDSATPPMPSYSLSGVVQTYLSVADFAVQGQRVDASSAVFSKGTAAKLAETPAPKVKVVGTRFVNGLLIADTVQF